MKTRVLPTLGLDKLKLISQACKKEHNSRNQKRLLVLRLIGQHEHTATEIAKIAEISRASVFNYLKVFLSEGLDGLLASNHKGSKPSLNRKMQENFKEQLESGHFTRAKDAQAWLKNKGVSLDLPAVYYWLGKVGGVLKVPRKTHAKKDVAKVEEFRNQLASKLNDLSISNKKVRIWVADEHRYGLLPVIRRCWGLKGVRIHAPYATRYQWGYLYEALEVDGDNSSEFFFAPSVNKEITQIFLEQISASDTEACHVIIWDGAGFHQKDGETGVPPNIRLIKLPPYSPELNPVEHLGDMIKDSVCNKLFDDLKTLEDKILKEINRFRNNADAVAGLIHDWLLNQVNFIEVI
jgi:transposase